MSDSTAEPFGAPGVPQPSQGPPDGALSLGAPPDGEAVVADVATAGTPIDAVGGDASAQDEAPLQPPSTGSPAEVATKTGPVPVRSLVDLYTAKGANPKKLFKELAAASSWTFDESDVAAALQVIGTGDPKLEKTRRLLWEAIETRDGRFRRTAAAFAQRAVEAETRGVTGWPLSPDTEPPEALAGLAARLASDLADGKRRNRAHNILMIAVDLFSSEFAVPFEDIASVLREALGTPVAVKKRNPKRQRVASVTRPRNDIEVVRELLALLEPWQQDVRVAEAERSAALCDVSAARSEVERAERDVDDLRRRLAAADDELSRLRQETESAGDLLKDARILANVETVELRAHSTAFLTSRLQDLLNTAKEANDLVPPRTETAQRLIDQAMAEVRREVEWLKSSD